MMPELSRLRRRPYAVVVDSAQDSRPAYVQVADTLRREISGGRFKPGERLASVRELAARFETAPVTARHALTVLRDEGWIYAQSTRGYFVREELPTQASGAVASSEEYLELRTLLLGVQESVDALSQRVNDLEARVAAAGDSPSRREPEPVRRGRRSR